MRLTIRKIGNWSAFNRMAVNLNKDLHEARVICLKRWALKAEGTAKKHLSTQDLARGFWKPLAIYTIQKRLAQGYGTDTLVETSTYLQSITSWVDTGTAYVGVKRGVVYTKGDSPGQQLSNIAKIQEFGSMTANIPARPLWQPTFTETMQWHVKMNKPGMVFLEIIRKKYTV